MTSCGRICRKGLGFSKADRDANVERIGWVASRLTRHGAAVIVSAISPYSEARRKARALVEAEGVFLEIHVATPVEECERRDVKGLYAKARAGEIPEFTGVSDPYEEPAAPELRLDTTTHTEGVGAARDREARGDRLPGSACVIDRVKLTHLQRLEAEAIDIMREVVAEAENPVMLYSIGKDSSVMLHLARKAFYPAPPPFPFLHVDTTWKFQDMYRFRERMAAEHGFDLLVHVNEDGLARGINPFDSGSVVHTDVMKTEGLKQALDKYGFDAAFGGARRDEERSRAKERIFSFRSAQHRWDPKNQRPELWRLYNARHRRASRCASSRSRTGPSSTSGCTSICEKYSDRSALLCGRASDRDAGRDDDHGRRRAHAARGGRGAGAEARCVSARSAVIR